MSGSFSIKVDPHVTAKNNSSLINYSINSTEYTVTALDITVTHVHQAA